MARDGLAGQGLHDGSPTDSRTLDRADIAVIGGRGGRIGSMLSDSGRPSWSCVSAWSGQLVHQREREKSGRRDRGAVRIPMAVGRATYRRPINSDARRALLGEWNGRYRENSLERAHHEAGSDAGRLRAVLEASTRTESETRPFK